MKILFLLYLCAILALQVNSSNISPHDLTDEAQQQIDNLKNVVQGQILAAHNSLSENRIEFLANSEDVTEQGRIDIEEAYQTATNEIIVIKGLSDAAGLDSDHCIDLPQQFINRLYVELTNGLRRCTTVVDLEVNEIVAGADYRVDIEWTKVGRHEYELNRCKGQILCITTIVTEVQLDIVRMPQNILTEVAAIKSLLDTLELSINQCFDINVSQFASQSTTLITNIQNCIDGL